MWDCGVISDTSLNALGLLGEKNPHTQSLGGGGGEGKPTAPSVHQHREG